VNGIQKWKDRVALVTGASSGIGRAVAHNLADNGMRVAICARRAERLEEIQTQIQAAGGSVLALPADLRDEAQILDMFAAIRREWGGVDVLVNNAAIGHRVSLLDGDSDRWREMLELNVLALCICTREAVRDMRSRSDDGYVIHMSSMGAHRQNTASTGNGLYVATKHAVRALTEALRRELRAEKSGIRVTAISPGLVETEFAVNFLGSPEKARESYSRFPVLQPEDIAELIEFLLSRPAHVQAHDILIRPTEQDT
jgi:NADP-dependent 3-hydroxy acid dehydrogenase YdfG